MKRLDCILDVLDMVLNDEKEYPDKNDEGYLKLHELYVDLKRAYKETYEGWKKAGKQIQGTQKAAPLISSARCLIQRRKITT